MTYPIDPNDESEFDETRVFRSIQNANGEIARLDDVRRNGVGIPRPTPISSEQEVTDLGILLQTYRLLMYNLNSTERRIWVRLLLGRPFEEVASEFGFSRPNLYCRIRGDGKGYGGMIAKNENVAIWWRRRGGKSVDASARRQRP